MGFSGRETAGRSRSFELIALPLNVVSQAFFGTLVGAAYGYAELTRSFWSFVGIVLVIEMSLIGIGAGLVYKRRSKVGLNVARQF